MHRMRMCAGRGTVLADLNDDGLLDIVYGNWLGPHRMMIQKCDGTFENYATEAMAVPSPVSAFLCAGVTTMI